MSDVLFCKGCLRTEEHCRCIIPDFTMNLSRFAAPAPREDLPSGVHDIGAYAFPADDKVAAICELDGCAELQRPRGQTPRQSMIEVAVNYIIGFLLSWAVSALLLNVIMGFNASVANNFWFTVVFTVVSVARSYIIRRIFNHLHTK